MKRLFKLLIIVLLIVIAFPSEAHAYLDPGTGSYVLQILAAVFFGGIFVVKTFWGKIKSFFTNMTGKDKNHSEKPSKKDK